MGTSWLPSGNELRNCCDMLLVTVCCVVRPHFVPCHKPGLTSPSALASPRGDLLESMRLHLPLPTCDSCLIARDVVPFPDRLVRFVDFLMRANRVLGNRMRDLGCRILREAGPGLDKTFHFPYNWYRGSLAACPGATPGQTLGANRTRLASGSGPSRTPAEACQSLGRSRPSARSSAPLINPPKSVSGSKQRERTRLPIRATVA